MVGWEEAERSALLSSAVCRRYTTSRKKKKKLHPLHFKKRKKEVNEPLKSKTDKAELPTT